MPDIIMWFNTLGFSRRHGCEPGFVIVNLHPPPDPRIPLPSLLLIMNFYHPLSSSDPDRCNPSRKEAFMHGWAAVGILSELGALALGPTSLKREEGHHAVWIHVDGVELRRWGWCGGGRIRENEATSTIIIVDVEFKLRSQARSSCSISTHSSVIKNIKQ